MKKSKLHVLPLQTAFLKKIKAGEQYYNQNHYINLGVNSLEILSFNDSPQDEYWPTDSLFEKVLKTLSIHNPKYLTKLDITIQGSSLLNTSTIRHFGLSLARHFKTLKKLNLRFLSCHELNRGNLRYLLGSVTKGMECLTEVNIYFLGCTDLDDQCLKDVKLSLLKQCKKLQGLKAVISGKILDLYEKGFVYFEPNLDERLQIENPISQFNNLVKRNRVTRKGDKSFCRGIARYLQKLRSLTFTLSTSRQEEDAELAKVTFKMIACLTNLEDLNLSVPEIDDKGLAELIYCIGRNLKKMQSLSIDFPLGNTISGGGCQQLAQNLFPSLPPHLTYFALNLEYCSSLTDEVVGKIGLGIARNLRNLQTLILSFNCMDQLTWRALWELTQIISKGLPSLKKLILGFPWCEEVKQRLPLILPKQIQQFDLYICNPQLMLHKTWKNLNRLNLRFDECLEQKSFLDLFSKPSVTLKNVHDLTLIYSQSGKIENKHILKLASKIGTKLENLTNFKLEFSDCPLLTSKSLLSLSDNICQKLRNLRHLSFSFLRVNYYFNRSSLESGIRDLLSIITPNIERLESLTLNFQEWMYEEMNTEKMLDEICSKIAQNLKELKKLTLMFNLCENLALKRQIRHKLNHIPNLYIH